MDGGMDWDAKKAPPTLLPPPAIICSAPSRHDVEVVVVVVVKREHCAGGDTGESPDVGAGGKSITFRLRLSESHPAFLFCFFVSFLVALLCIARHSSDASSIGLESTHHIMLQQ